MILLDTNVISETQRRTGSPRVKALVDRHARDFFLSAVVMGELRFGIAVLRNAERKRTLATWYEVLALTYADVILPVTLWISERWGDVAGRLRASGRTVDAPDGLIAATALHHDLTLWTRYTHDFADTGVRLFNPGED